MHSTGMVRTNEGVVSPIETSRAWLGTVLACIPVLPKDELKRKILTLAVSKGQLSQTISSRQNSCRIVGEIALRFSSESMW